MKYDSKAEMEAEPEFNKLGATRCDDFFAVNFTDKNGEDFCARPDYWHAQSQTFIEYKSHTLNKKNSRRSAERKIRDQQKHRRGEATLWDQLNFAWNHSAYKQAIVQQKLGYQNFVVCFKNPPSLEEAEYYENRGIVWCTLKSLRNYLAVIYFQKRGLAVSFKYHANDYTCTVN